MNGWRGICLGLCVLVAGMSAPARAAGLAVRDDSGTVVQLAAPARRIVSLSPHATELLFSAGAGAQLVGVSRYSDSVSYTHLTLPTILRV